MIGLWLLLACGDPEPLLDCESPEAGDLEGYCILGENDGPLAAAADIAVCAEEPAVPSDMAEGPGGCTDPSQAVLDAEQAEYARCWQEAYDAVIAAAAATADTGPCEPADDR